MVQNLQTQEQLRAHLDARHQSGKPSWPPRPTMTRGLPTARAWPEQTFQAIGALAGLLAALRDELGAMSDPLDRLHRPPPPASLCPARWPQRRAATRGRSLSAGCRGRAVAMVNLLLLTPPTEGHRREALAGRSPIATVQRGGDYPLSQHHDRRNLP